MDSFDPCLSEAWRSPRGSGAKGSIAGAASPLPTPDSTPPPAAEGRENRCAAWIIELGETQRLSRGALERVKGIEPSYEAWEAAVLPLNYTREGTHSSVAGRPASTSHAVRRKYTLPVPEFIDTNPPRAATYLKRLYMPAPTAASGVTEPLPSDRMDRSQTAESLGLTT